MKKEYQGQCIFCGQPISTNQVGVGYTKTKRKQLFYSMRRALWDAL